MSIRSTWSGQLGFGLVNIPVKLYKATDSHDVPLHQYVETEEGPHRVGRKNIDLTTGETVEFRDIVSGTEVGEQIVLVTKDEKVALEDEQGKLIEILQFVKADKIDPIKYDTAQYVGPNKGGEKGYALLVATMGESGLVAVARFTQRGKTQIVAIRVLDGVLVLHALLWADEVRPAITVPTVKFSDAELAAATTLVESLYGDFDHSSHTDTYQERLGELIAAKAAGAEFLIETPAAANDVSDLLAALTASVKAKKGKAA